MRQFVSAMEQVKRRLWIFNPFKWQWNESLIALHNKAQGLETLQQFQLNNSQSLEHYKCSFFELNSGKFKSSKQLSTTIHGHWSFLPPFQRHIKTIRRFSFLVIAKENDTNEETISPVLRAGIVEMWEFPEVSVILLQ